MSDKRYIWTEDEIRKGLDRLHNLHICPVCGQMMAHYRRYGYRCANPEHHEQAMLNAILRKGRQDR